MTDLERLEFLMKALAKQHYPEEMFLRDFTKRDSYIRDDQENIIQLDLSHCLLTSEILTLISEFTRLRELGLCKTNINDICALNSLVQLERLRLADSPISDISPLKELSQLQHLSLSGTQVSDLTPLKGLSQLQNLGLGRTQVSDLIPLKGLTQLQDLRLDGTQVSDLTPLNGLTQLQGLNLGGTQVSDLTPLIGLTKLQGLNLGGTQVSDLTPLNGLTQLQHLSLSGTQVSDLTPLIGLTQLQGLNLGGTQVSDLTPLNGLTQIQDLSLHDTQVSNVSPLKGLIQLQSLDLSHTQLSDLNPLQGLSHLYILNLTNTNVSDLDTLKSICSSIECLQLCDCPITHLPEWLTELGLPIIWTTIWYEAGITLYNNPLIEPPPEIVKQGTDAIRSYFKQLKQQPQDYLFEAKLLVVGEPGAGKTTLIKKLQDLNAPMPQEAHTTRGIDVNHLTFDCKPQESIDSDQSHLPEHSAFRLNLWDFGGQEIYQATHRFFLSRRSLYVLVADSRNEDTDFTYWLHIIEQLAPDSPLLIVLNEKHDRRRTIPLTEIKARFHQVKDCLAVDLSQVDKRLITLRETIQHQVRQLPHIGSPLPGSWLKVRETLETKAETYPTINREKYERLCQTHGIEQRDDINTLSQYFHDIGVCLHFQDDPLLNKTLFLNPNWVTQAVYALLDHPLLTQQQGHFNRQQAALIWRDDQYQPLLDELLALINRFYLAYKVPDQDQYIVPQHLPASPPAYEWQKNNTIKLHYHYGLFMPKGLLTQCIVRMHRDIEDNQEDNQLVWRKGVVLKRQYARARIIESLTESVIRIEVSGSQQRDLMILIKEEFDKIHRSYERLTVEVKIPCHCSECNTASDPCYYTWAELEQRKAKGKPTIECRTSYRDVSVHELLDRYKAPETVQAVKANTHCPRLFISYAHTDELHLNTFLSHLKPLQRQKQLSYWYDRKIKAGSEWNQDIERALDRADWVVCLVSSDFLASDFCMEKELPHALARQEDGSVKILWILLRPCQWQDTELASLQALTQNNQAITEHTNNDTAWNGVMDKLKQLLMA